jgi:insulysin
VRVKPVKEKRALELQFPFPDQRPHIRTKPGHVIAHIIGYEGAGSLLSYLKSKKHWVEYLSSYPSRINGSQELFRITMYLTKEGLGL